MDRDDTFSAKTFPRRDLKKIRQFSATLNNQSSFFKEFLSSKYKMYRGINVKNAPMSISIIERLKKFLSRATLPLNHSSGRYKNNITTIAKNFFIGDKSLFKLLTF